jgi:CheY-like chemotaxis protein
MAKLARILIADDEPTFLRSTADLLIREGYECDTAPDAPTAAEMLKRGGYDLLIADIKMPGNPDLELISGMPQIAQGLPVILVTGYPSLATAIQSVELPVVAYLVKPFDLAELLEHVNASIQHRRVYCAVASVHERVRTWEQHLAEFREALDCKASTGNALSVDAFLDVTLGNIVGALTDLRHLAEGSTAENGEGEPCHLLNCPKLGDLTEALARAIEVLEQTKGSFKSKQLADLRESLEEQVKRVRGMSA